MKVSENISLRDYNSFGVDARATRLVEWETPDELRETGFTRTSGAESSRGLPEGLFDGAWMALGGGNNILFTKDFEGTLLKSAARKIEITAETPETLSVRAEAGVDWDEFTAWCIARNLWGVENLSGVPGTVGAAPIQNIGAYGAEARDVICSVECFSIPTGNILTLATEHCGFGYRDSVFKHSLKGKVIVTAVDFTLSKTPRPNLTYAALAETEVRLRSEAGLHSEARRRIEGYPKSSTPTLESIRRAVLEIRDSKLPDPRVTGNAGSFFKNPVVDKATARRLAAEYPTIPLYPCDTNGAKDGSSSGTGSIHTPAALDPGTAAAPGKTKLAAGWLIEQAGWKGRSEGRVGIHPRQALIVVNLGGATGGEIADFSRKVCADVRHKFGIDLTPEVNIV